MAQNESRITKFSVKTLTIMCLVLFFVAVPFTLILRISIPRTDENLYASLMFGHGFAFLFQWVFVFIGFLDGTFKVETLRLKNFVSNVKINGKYARNMLIDDIKSNGLIFWLFLLIMILTVVIIVICFFEYNKINPFAGFYK